MYDKFININGTRIIKSNIKNFGVTLKEKNEQGLFAGLTSMINGNGFLKSYLGIEKIKYLYVTTYQNDNFEFTQNQIDIESVIKELENI
jgi:hypothetical protein